MSRTEIFNSSNPKGKQIYRSLRTHAQEAAAYLTGREYDGPGKDQAPLAPRKFGRGASGESSN